MIEIDLSFRPPIALVYTLFHVTMKAGVRPCIRCLHEATVGHVSDCFSHRRHVRFKTKEPAPFVSNNGEEERCRLCPRSPILHDSSQNSLIMVLEIVSGFAPLNPTYETSKSCCHRETLSETLTTNWRDLFIAFEPLWSKIPNVHLARPSELPQELNVH